MDDMVLTPEEVAKLLKLSKGTVYELLKRGEIIGKRLGNTYRIPRRSLSFVFEGMDADILDAVEEDKKNLSRVQKAIAITRAKDA